MEFKMKKLVILEDEKCYGFYVIFFYSIFIIICICYMYGISYPLVYININFFI
jgi:hypothetical protein